MALDVEESFPVVIEGRQHRPLEFVVECGSIASRKVRKIGRAERQRKSGAKIRKIDPGEALKLQGVLQVFTHDNAPKLSGSDRNYQDDDVPAGSPFRPLHDDEILYSGQPIALVVAETFELARYAGSTSGIYP